MSSVERIRVKSTSCPPMPPPFSFGACWQVLRELASDAALHVPGPQPGDLSGVEEAYARKDLLQLQERARRSEAVGRQKLDLT